MVNPYRIPGLDPEDESGYGPAHSWELGQAELRFYRRWFDRHPRARRGLFWFLCLVAASMAGLIVAHLIGLL